MGAIVFRHLHADSSHRYLKVAAGHTFAQCSGLSGGTTTTYVSVERLVAIADPTLDVRHKQPASEVTVDKCFGQIVPLLAKVTLHLGGMPWQVLGPYARTMAGVQAVNMLPQGVGAPYSKQSDSFPKVARSP